MEDTNLCVADMKNIRAFIMGITLLLGLAGCSTPHPKTVTGVPSASTTATALEDGRLLYEMGKLDDSEQKLQAVLEIEPDNTQAQYYLALVHRAQYERQYRQPTPKGYYQTIPQQPIY